MGRYEAWEIEYIDIGKDALEEYLLVVLKKIKGLSNMKKILKFFVIWCSLSFICTYLIYLLHGENFQLLKVDVLNLFEHNRRIFWGDVFPLFIIVTLFLVMAFFKKRAYSFIVRILVKGKEIHFEICYLKMFHKHINWIVLISVLVGLMLGYTGFMKDKNMNERKNYLSSRLIIHAMGLIDGSAYTNSLEAFQAHYENGQRYFETDFSVTSDDQLVARHDWQGVDLENIPTEEVFLNTPIYGKYTPLSLKNIIYLMQQYEDVYIITDTKDDDPVIARKDISILVETAREMNAMDVLDRFVIQFYNIEMYEAIKDIYDFPYYIFTLYAVWYGDENEFIDYCRFCVANGVRTITMWDYRLADNPRLSQIADQYGIAVYVHTVNDWETVEEMLSLGVYGIYTDDEAVMDNNW